MAREMLINTVQGQECRIAVVGSAGLEEYYVERASRARRVGNIYKGRVTNVEAAIQAAFVDFGLSKNGFLHISDVHPQYFPKGQQSAETVGRKRPHRDRPPIQTCLRRGQEVIVQMIKEGIGTKGPTLTSYLSIPGRMLVMMPGMTRLGVSRKIEDDEARAKARTLLGQLKLPGNMGFIIRTAGLDRSKRDLQRDLNYLLRLWKSVSQRIKEAKAPAEIYQESDLVIRTLRDVYDTGIDRIICDNESVARRVREFLSVAMPRTKHQICSYTGKEGLYHDFGLEEEIEKIYARRVELASGGSLVIDQTEALVAIDVNSGRFREHTNAETTAKKVNQEAAKEIGRQLRLRDLGGVVIIDFIDMREEKNRRAVEHALREAIRPDRAKTKILRISRLGIVEMTRQRVGPSLETSFYRTCAHCNGSGMIKSEESQALLVLRYLQRATSVEDVAEIEVSVTPSVAHHLGNYQRRQISQLEAETGIAIVVRADTGLAGDEVNVVCRNNRGSVVAWEQKAKSSGRKKQIPTVALEELPAGELPPDEPFAEDEPEAEVKKTPKAAAEKAAPQPKKSRRRGRRGGRKRKKGATQPPDQSAGPQAAEPGPPSPAEPPVAADRDRSQARRKKKPPPAPGAEEQGKAEPASEEQPTKPSRRSRRRKAKRKKAEKAPQPEADEAPQAPPEEPPAPAAAAEAPARPPRPRKHLPDIPAETQAKLEELFEIPPAGRAASGPEAQPPTADRPREPEPEKPKRRPRRRTRKKKTPPPPEDAAPLFPAEPQGVGQPAAEPALQQAPPKPTKKEPARAAKKAGRTTRKRTRKTAKAAGEAKPDDQPPAATEDAAEPKP